MDIIQLHKRQKLPLFLIGIFVCVFSNLSAQTQTIYKFDGNASNFASLLKHTTTVTEGIDNPFPDEVVGAGAKVAKVVRGATQNGGISFQLNGKLLGEGEKVFKIKIYQASGQAEYPLNNNIFFQFKKSAGDGDEYFSVQTIDSQDEWVEYTFDFSDKDFTQATYNRVILFLGSGDTKEVDGIEYYISSFDGPEFDYFNDPTLTAINIGGQPLDGFSSEVESYEFELPVGTTEVPTVTAVTNDENATVEVTDASNIYGTTTIKVTAEDGSTVKNYTVSFDVSGREIYKFDGNANFASLLTHTTTVTEGIDNPFPDEVVGAGVKVAKVVRGATQNGGISINFNGKLQSEGEKVFRLKLYQASGQADYPVNNNIFLQVDKSEGAGEKHFLSKKIETQDEWVEYIFDLSDKDFTQATYHKVTLYLGSGDTKEVDGIEYYISVFEGPEVDYFNDPNLTAINIGGQSLDGFSSEVENYEVELPIGTVEVPTVTGVTSDENATVEVTDAANIYGTTTIKVTAENGSTVKNYTVSFDVSGREIYKFDGNANFASLLEHTTTVTEGIDNPFPDEVVGAGVKVAKVVRGATQNGGISFKLNGKLQSEGEKVFRLKVYQASGQADYPNNNNIFLQVDKSEGAGDRHFLAQTIETQDEWVEYVFDLSDKDFTQATYHRVIVFLGSGDTKEVDGIEYYISVFEGPEVDYYNDATLTAINIGGEPLDGFASDVESYSIDLPSGTADVPNVTATANDKDATVEVTQAANIYGTANIKVTSQDGSTIKNYTVKFDVPEGRTIYKFDGSTYPVTLHGFESTPTFNVDNPLVNDIVSDAKVAKYTRDGQGNATVEFRTSASLMLEESKVFRLKLYQASGQATYPSNNAILFRIGNYKVGGVPQKGTYANINQQDEWVEYIFDLSDEVFAEGDEYNKIDIYIGTSNGSSGLGTEYYIAELEGPKPSSDNTLSTININGQPLDGFSSEQESYEIDLPVGTTEVPTVTAVTNDEGATVKITDAETFYGTTNIEVTAVDGVTKDYTISFNVLGREIYKFDGGSYFASLNKHFTTVTENIENPFPDEVVGADVKVAKVVRGAVQNGGISFSLNGQLQSEGEKVFRLRVYQASGQADYPNNNNIFLQVKKSNNEDAGSEHFIAQTIENQDEWVEYIFDLSDKDFTQATYSRVVIFLGSGDTKEVDGVEYYFATVEGPQVNYNNDATLSTITLGGEALENFSSDKETYDVDLPSEVTKVPTIVAVPSNENATVDMVKTEDLNGTSTITVTAEDGTTKKTYTINFSSDVIENIWDGSSWSKGTPINSSDVKVTADYTGNGFICRNLVIEAGKTLDIGTGTLNVEGNLTNNGSLIIKSGASLFTYEGTTFSGNDVTIERNTRYSDGQYSFVGSVVKKKSALKGKALGKSIYKYDETKGYGDDEGLARWVKASKDVLIPGKGYTQAYKQKLVFTGEPNNGKVTYTGTYTTDAKGTSVEGWNLVANPYPTAIDIFKFLNEAGNTQNIEGSVYIWDDNGSDKERGTNEDYIIINGVGITSSSRRKSDSRLHKDGGAPILGAGQGFFVKLRSDRTSEDISFTESMRKAGMNADGNFFRTATTDERQTLRLSIESSDKELFGGTLLGFLEDATEGVDRLYDALQLSTNDLQLYSLLNQNHYAIQGLPALSGERMVALGMDVAEAGTYAFDIAKLENISDDIVIELIDTKLNVIHNLSESAYSFETEAVVEDTRFILNIRNAVISGLEIENMPINFNVNIEGVQVFDVEDCAVSIMDVTGKILLHKNLKRTTQVPFNFDSNKLYIIKVNHIVKKVFFNN